MRSYGVGDTFKAQACITKEVRKFYLADFFYSMFIHK